MINILYEFNNLSYKKNHLKHLKLSKFKIYSCSPDNQYDTLLCSSFAILRELPFSPSPHEMEETLGEKQSENNKQ